MVVGGTSGLGKFIVNALYEESYNVVVIGRQKNIIDDLETKSNGKVYGVSIDLTDTLTLEKFFSNNNRKFYGMIYCAGINQGSLIKINDRLTAQQVMNINCISFMEISKFFCNKKHSVNGASVVAISSMASLKNAPGMAIYSSSKAAMNSAVKTISKEYIGRKIRVNAILPGYLEQPMQSELNSWNVTDEAISRIQPFGRIPYLQIYKMVEFLLSENSQYITGNLIEISGGQ